MIGGTKRNRSLGKSRLIIALIFIGFSVISYMSSKEYNPVTGENQYISLTPRQEIALGMQAAPQMIRQHGGLYPDQKYQDMVDRIGNALLRNSKAGENVYQYEFHLLNDRNTINAFALPGGQIFITAALFAKLETEAQLAGVLGHEIAHVVARHSAQQMAKQNLTKGILNGVLVASESVSSAQAAQYLGQLVNMKFGRDDELESDKLGVRFMVKSGYDPTALIGVMKILAESKGGRSQPEFFSTHPNPANRVERIKQAINELYPNGLPSGLKK